jgi:hypothetical protein
MTEEHLDLLKLATGSPAQLRAGPAIMPHAALSTLCRMPDYAESVPVSRRGRPVRTRSCGIIRHRKRKTPQGGSTVEHQADGRHVAVTLRTACIRRNAEMSPADGVPRFRCPPGAEQRTDYAE